MSLLEDHQITCPDSGESIEIVLDISVIELHQ